MAEPTAEDLSASAGYVFESDYVTRFAATWQEMLSAVEPTTILEIGCYEGISSAYWIEQCARFGQLEIHCLDMWDPGGVNVREQRFDHNIAIALKTARQNTGRDVVLHKAKGDSKLSLAKLLSSENRPVFDFVYVDGSHTGPGVLSDAVLAFDMLRPGGIMLFDDYLWAGPVPQYNTAMEQADIHNTPKIGIDAFISVYQRQVRIIANVPLYQLAVIKVG